MDAKLTMKLGNKELTIEGKGTTEVMMMKVFSFWSQLPSKCSCCKGENISLYHRSPKGNDYYGLKCMDCNAEFMFHQFKTGGFYSKLDDKFEQWFKDEPKKESVAAQVKDDGQNDIPF